MCTCMYMLKYSYLDICHASIMRITIGGLYHRLLQTLYHILDILDLYVGDGYAQAPWALRLARWPTRS